MTTTLVNLTPHAVRVLTAEGQELVSVPPSGKVARVAVTLFKQGVVPLTDNAGDILAGMPHASIPVVVGRYGEVTGLPDPVTGTVFIVSAMVRQAFPLRRDVLSPADLIRDASGTIVGCRALEANI